jgi:hypothetical protein
MTVLGLSLQIETLDLTILQPYSPDLAPCDFHLFPKMKEDLSENLTQMKQWKGLSGHG